MKLVPSGFRQLCETDAVENFEYYYTKDKPVIFNFHGYPQTIKQLLFDSGQDTRRFRVNGYVENGSTTTTFDMQIRNGTSRYDLVIQATQALSDSVVISERQEAIVNKYKRKLADHREYIIKNGADPDEIENWTWQA
jgi:xylulose-5-phosphate/fructose-6-phosphate phosphoketolase